MVYLHLLNVAGSLYLFQLVFIFNIIHIFNCSL